MRGVVDHALVSASVIARFGDDSALILVDVQVGIDDIAHWGGPQGRRNNPEAEANCARLLAAGRAWGMSVVFTMQDSLEQASPLKVALPTGRLKEGFEPLDGDAVIVKQVNGAFFGTDLEIRLRRAGVQRLVVGGFFTNMCVETTVRTAGNLGFDVYLAHDACATTNRRGLDGVDHDAELVHALSVASMHGEFCTALATDEVLSLLDGDRQDLERVQGNDPAVR